ncbi:MAG TPA: bifunctional hydroxymethylpyrimidine kinase/phosphomethylpyrimidine kinase [Pyrinomonadaceae bacterium]|nr:bifunctional hydroxymethylpyrimidine kinase/phosphomethylpyrimidine kinase [Pyrinomonadaceae bacterium]
MESRATVPVALTVAGLDPSGGAGIIADIRTFAAFGCFGTAAITSLTFQNTTRVFGAVHQTAATVRAQVTPIVEDFTVSCAKTGMLPTREIIAEVARLFRANLPAPVVDPVMRATSGDDLINDDAVACLVSELFPLARLVTPNIPEAERLTGLIIRDEQTMKLAASQIRQMGARAVLVKGGHLAGASGGRQEAGGAGEAGRSDQPVMSSFEAIDVLDDEGTLTVFRDELIPGGERHGSGCTLSAAIAAGLGNGVSLNEAIQTAKRYVTEAIRRSPKLGHGSRPLW